MTLLRVAAYKADKSGFVAGCPRAHKATESGFTRTATQAVKGTNGALQQLSCLSDPCRFPFLRQPSRYTTTLSTGQSSGQSTGWWTVHCPRDSPQDSCQIYCPPPMSRNFSKCRGTWRNFLNLQRDAAQNSKRTTRPSSLGRPRLHVRPQSFSPPASSTAGMRVHH